MTPRQILAEILRDYKFNMEMGMTKEQSLEVLKAMVVDLIEYEKELSHKEGFEAGQYSILWERRLKEGLKSVD